MDEPASAPGMPGGPPAREAEIRHVPADGISVFANPDATAAPIMELPSGFALTVVGRRPPWVHVQAPDGLDGWVDGTALAGVAVGAAPIEPTPVPEGRGPFVVAHPSAVVDKQGSSILLGTGPVLGAIGGIVAILGAFLPWIQTLNGPDSADAFQVSARILTGWDQASKGGWKLGWVIVIVAGIGTLVSMISGGGIVRRLMGLVLIIMCAVFVLQIQDYLTNVAAGLGTGTNVWDIVDYGVLVTFGGGVVMLFAPSR
ncbi:MAG: SH3 domain-containing protein [Acidimicrobiia bacterium]